jgi:hypothetical protein
VKKPGRLQMNSSGTIRGVGMRAGFRGTEYILITETIDELRRIWRSLNPKAPIDETNVQRIEIKSAK